MNKEQVVVGLSVLGTIVIFIAGLSLVSTSSIKHCKNNEDLHYNTQVVESSDFYNACDLFVTGITYDYCEVQVSLDCPDSVIFSKWFDASKLKKVR